MGRAALRKSVVNSVLELNLENHEGSVWFTTDIHGHFDLLNEQLQLQAFDATKDLLVVGGDNCDRGPCSDWILDYINEPWYISVRGNHEQMVVDYIESLALGEEYRENEAARMLYHNGGEWFFDQPWSKQMAIYESFKSLPLGIELKFEKGVVGVVHAQCPWSDWGQFKEMSWEGAESTAIWARSKYDFPERFDYSVQGVDYLLSGHTPTKSGDIEWVGNQVYADTGCFFSGKLAFIQVALNGKCLLSEESV